MTAVLKSQETFTGEYPRPLPSYMNPEGTFQFYSISDRSRDAITSFAAELSRIPERFHISARPRASNATSTTHGHKVSHPRQLAPPRPQTPTLGTTRKHVPTQHRKGAPKFTASGPPNRSSTARFSTRSAQQCLSTPSPPPPPMTTSPTSSPSPQHVSIPAGNTQTLSTLLPLSPPHTTHSSHPTIPPPVDTHNAASVPHHKEPGYLGTLLHAMNSPLQRTTIEFGAGLTLLQGFSNSALHLRGFDIFTNTTGPEDKHHLANFTQALIQAPHDELTRFNTLCRYLINSPPGYIEALTTP